VKELHAFKFGFNIDSIIFSYYTCFYKAEEGVCIRRGISALQENPEAPAVWTALPVTLIPFRYGPGGLPRLSATGRSESAGIQFPASSLLRFSAKLYKNSRM
jgi:hypothetical protein